MLQLYVQSNTPGSLTHDITPVWTTSAQEELNMTASLAATASVTFNVTANIDISSACTATHDPIETGRVSLTLELTKADIQGLDHLYDWVPQNNKFVTGVDVDCGTGESCSHVDRDVIAPSWPCHRHVISPS